MKLITSKRKKCILHIEVVLKAYGVSGILAYNANHEMISLITY